MGLYKFDSFWWGLNFKPYEIILCGKPKVVLFFLAGSPYGVFAGRDASRGLATFSLTEDVLKDEYDDLSDLTSMQMESVREWEMQFTGKCFGFFCCFSFRVYYHFSPWYIKKQIHPTGTLKWWFGKGVHIIHPNGNLTLLYKIEHWLSKFSTLSKHLHRNSTSFKQLKIFVWAY